MKYVMLITDHGQRLPVLFPDSLNHDTMAMLFAAGVEVSLNAKAKAISAGFVNLGNDVEVHGESTTLKLEPMPHDAARIMIGDSIAFMPDAELAPLFDKLKAAAKDDTLEYLLSCVEHHVQKFPVPEHMLAAVKRLREAHGLTAPAPTPEPAKCICDCERGHNGIDLTGRECDCPAGKQT